MFRTQRTRFSVIMGLFAGLLRGEPLHGVASLGGGGILVSAVVVMVRENVLSGRPDDGQEVKEKRKFHPGRSGTFRENHSHSVSL